MVRIVARVAIGLLLASPAGATALQSLQEVDDCSDANMPTDSSVQTVVMKAHDRIGSVTQTRAKIYWRRFENDLSKILVRLNDPPEMRGAAILMLETKGNRSEIFMYLPELDRVKRVTGHMMSGSVFGTDFSYEEFEGLQGLENTDFERSLTGTDSVGGRPVYVIESTAKPGLEKRPNYEKTVTYVDQEWCLPLKVEFFERGGRLRKRMTSDATTVENHGGRNISRRLEIIDLRDETKTELEIEEIEFDAKVSKSMFSTRTLDRMGGKSF